MKNINKTTIILAICTMAVGLLLGWLIFGRSSETQTDAHIHTAMARNGEGVYWLSSEKDIKNPYFGQAMLSCREKTIK